jgi:hypothetical protein
MTTRATLLLAVVALAVPAGTAGAQERDFVAGSAKNQFADVPAFPVGLEVAAHGFDAELPTLEGLFGASGVTGHVVGSGTLPNGEFRTEGEVTCLRVVGNRATIKYRFKTTHGAGAPPPGWGVQVFVEDNGEPGDGVRDANATDAPMPPELFEPQAGVCEPPRGPYNPVDSGNYVVVDGD